MLALSASIGDVAAANIKIGGCVYGFENAHCRLICGNGFFSCLERAEVNPSFASDTNTRCPAVKLATGKSHFCADSGAVDAIQEVPSFSQVGPPVIGLVPVHMVNHGRHVSAHIQERQSVSVVRDSVQRDPTIPKTMRVASLSTTAAFLPACPTETTSIFVVNYLAL